MKTKSLVPPPMRLAWMPLISSRVPTQASSSLVQALACHLTSLGVDYQGTARRGHIKVFTMSFINFSFTTQSVDLMGLVL